VEANKYDKYEGKSVSLGSFSFFIGFLACGVFFFPSIAVFFLLEHVFFLFNFGKEGRGCVLSLNGMNNNHSSLLSLWNLKIMKDTLRLLLFHLCMLALRFDNRLPIWEQ
jgi:hypothetical protein